MPTVALQQLNDGAIITAIQMQNQELCQNQLYLGQKSINPHTANVRYEFLQSDSTRLYRKFSQLHSVDIEKPPEINIDNWLNTNSPMYKPQLATAVFHYQAQVTQDEHFNMCNQTSEMKEVAWKCVLLFIALGVDEAGKGVPVAFLFIFCTHRKQSHSGGI
ncbi:hypothetical protein K439DRAFT_1623890 [Ramaria rubella]|nr:hypothetical protein K439DRAFT_1623890 [Ramaria rubella]